jgi:putative transcriptional regulator
MINKSKEEQLGNRLRELRARNRWTQQDLAGKVDVTRQTIIAIEKGQYSPSVTLALRISRVFQLPLEEVFFLEQ